MSFDFHFRTPDSTGDLRQLVDFLMKQHLDYPGYEDWVQRSEAEIDSGYKTPVLAFSGSHLVGDLIYQRHKQLPRVREIKNLRVHPALRRRDFAHFMLRQAEVDDADGCDAIICDARPDQKALLALMTRSGYTMLGSVSLYDPNVEEVVMVKTFNDQSREGIIYSAKNLIIGSN